MKKINYFKNINYFIASFFLLAFISLDLTLLLLKYYGIITENILSNINEIVAFTTGIAIGLILLIIFIFKLVKYYKLSFINWSDSFNCSLVINGVIFLFQYAFTYEFFDKTYNLIFLVLYSLLFVFGLAMMVARFFLICNKKENIDNLNSYSLIELIEKGNNGRTSAYINDESLASERLKSNSQFIIAKDYIDNYKGGTPLTIHIDGPWGSGKTTLWNTIKDSLDNKRFLIADLFDIWKYDDEKSMFIAMYQAIAYVSGLDIDEDMIYRLIEAAFGRIANIDQNSLDFIFFKKEKENKFTKIAQHVNSTLKKDNKIIVFPIDNIGRANKENILFLLKALSVILDFQNIIYVLLFDHEIINKAFDGKITDNKYFDKIINVTIPMPRINDYLVLEEFKKCIQDQFEYLFSVNNIKKPLDISLYMKALEISIPFKNYRDFIKFLNTCPMLVNYYKDVDVSLVELMALYTIKVCDENVYKFVLDNLDEMSILFGNEYLGTADDALKANLKGLFDKFKEGIKLKPFLEILSPEIRACTSYPIYVEADEKLLHFYYKETQSLYFNFDSNRFTYCENIANEIIEDINSGSDLKLHMYCDYQHYDSIIFIMVKNNISKIDNKQARFFVERCMRNLDLIMHIDPQIDDRLNIFSSLVSDVCDKYNLFKYLTAFIDTDKYIYFYYLLGEKYFYRKNNKDWNLLKKAINIRINFIANKYSKSYKSFSRINNGARRIYKLYYALLSSQKLDQIWNNNFNQGNFLYFIRDFVTVEERHGYYSYSIDMEAINGQTNQAYIDVLKFMNADIDNLTEDGEFLISLARKTVESSLYQASESASYRDFEKLYKQVLPYNGNEKRL